MNFRLHRSLVLCLELHFVWALGSWLLIFDCNLIRALYEIWLYLLLWNHLLLFLLHPRTKIRRQLLPISRLRIGKFTRCPNDISILILLLISNYLSQLLLPSRQASLMMCLLLDDLAALGWHPLINIIINLPTFNFATISNTSKPFLLRTDPIILILILILTHQCWLILFLLYGVGALVLRCILSLIDALYLLLLILMIRGPLTIQKVAVQASLISRTLSHLHLLLWRYALRINPLFLIQIIQLCCTILIHWLKCILIGKLVHGAGVIHDLAACMTAWLYSSAATGACLLGGCASGLRSRRWNALFYQISSDRLTLVFRSDIAIIIDEVIRQWSLMMNIYARCIVVDDHDPSFGLDHLDALGWCRFRLACGWHLARSTHDIGIWDDPSMVLQLTLAWDHFNCLLLIQQRVLIKRALSTMHASALL